MEFEPSPKQQPTPPRNAASSGLSGPSLGWILGGILAVVIVLFIVGNGHEAQINFLLFDWKTTVRFAIFVAVLLGVALDRVIDYALKRRKKRALKEKLKELDDK